MFPAYLIETLLRYCEQLNKKGVEVLWTAVQSMAATHWRIWKLVKSVEFCLGNDRNWRIAGGMDVS